MTKRIVPLEVPWMISPSVSAFGLSASEGGDCEIVAAVAVIRAPESAADEPSAVRVRVRAGGWIRMSPMLDDTDPTRSWSGYSRADVFDWSGEDIDEYLAEFKRRWEASGVCPDPRAYEVVGSQWIRDVGAERFGVKHFVLVGHDAWIEVLGKELSWEWV